MTKPPNRDLQVMSHLHIPLFPGIRNQQVTEEETIKVLVMGLIDLCMQWM